MSLRRDGPLVVLSFLLAAVVIGPLWGSGYFLHRDAVATPRSYVTDTALGIGGVAARATPQDWLIAIASSVVDGGWVVRLVLWAALGLAGWGYARAAVTVLPRVGTAGAAVAAVMAIVNPFVAERLMQGQWSLLTGYAALGWVVVFAQASDARLRWGGLAACFAGGGLTPTGAVLVLIMTVVMLPRRAWGALALFTVSALPWLVPSLIDPAAVVTDAASIDAFAARAEPHLGTTLTVAGLGGMWNAEAVPPLRASFAVWFTAVFLGVVAVGGAAAVMTLRRNTSGRRVHTPLLRLAALAVGAVAVVALAATGPGRASLAAVVEQFPAAGLARDTQKWVALAVPGYACCAAATVVLVRHVPRVFAALLAAMLLIAASPDTLWGGAGQLRPVHYPAGFEHVAREVISGTGDVVVVPSGAIRRFPWAGRAPVVDPAPRLVDAAVLQTGELQIDGVRVDRVPGRASAAADVLAAGGPDTAARLAEMGVGWVVVEASPQLPSAEFGLIRVVDTPEVVLLRVPGAIAPIGPGTTRRVIAWLGHLAWLLLGLTGAASAISGYVRARPARRLGR